LPWLEKEEASMVSQDIIRQLLIHQRNEITEHHIYRRLARLQKSPENRRILHIRGDGSAF
jgi:hypothetical protein